MLTDQQIRELITQPKSIKRKEPARGFQEENLQLRCDLDLEAVADPRGEFTVFIRQSSKYVENFSLGLRYRTNVRSLGTITLIRYNGPHGEKSRQPDGHYTRPHIHRITEAELKSGSTQPQENDREITDHYSTFEEALVVFFGDIGATNAEQHFYGLLQGRLFDEYL